MTDTVRGITRGQLPAQFIPRGTRRLKGIAEPVPVFAVVSGIALPVKRWSRSGMSGLLRRRLDRLALPLALAVGVLILTAVAIALIDPSLFGRAPEEPTPPAVVATSPTIPGEPEASPTAEPDPGAEREAANEALLARIHPDIARHCIAAHPEDAPTASVPLPGIPTDPIPTLAGLSCQLGGTGPDVVEYWLARREAQSNLSSGSSAQGVFFHLVGARNLPAGDCSTDTRAWSEWEFGSTRGNLLCSRFGGVALLMWTYEGTAVIGRATREDGDSERLYRWWEDHARLLAPGPSS